MATPIKEAISTALESLSLTNPSLASFVLAVEHKVMPDAEKAVAYTDGRTCFYGAAFAAFRPQERVGVVVHEWMHIAMRHMPRLRSIKSTGANPLIWNIATDIKINEAIEASRARNMALPASGLRPHMLEKMLGQDHPWILDLAEQKKRVTDAVAEMTAEQIYALLMQQHDKEMLDKLAAEAIDLVDTGVDLDDGEGGAAGEIELMRRRMNALAGDDPSGLLRAIANALPKPSIDWRRVLRSKLANALSTQRETSWSRRSRRLAALDLVGPGIRQEEAASAAIVVDTSGSIDDEILRSFMAEIRAIVRMTDSQVPVIACDADAYEAHIINAQTSDQQIKNLKLAGGGGTNFDPGITAAMKYQPDMIIYLTDLYGPVTIKPRVPLIWAVIGDNPPAPPFGTVLLIKSA